MRRAAGISSLVLLAIACAPDPAEVVGRWRNTTGQRLTVFVTTATRTIGGLEVGQLAGAVEQADPCAPPLSLQIHRDPYGAFALRFLENQPVYFPPEQKVLFAPNEYFCSSRDSVPMCSFCRVEGEVMSCTETEQKIAGRGATVHHACAWTRIRGTDTSTRAGQESCGPQADGGLGCPPAQVDPDAASADPDAGVSPEADASARD